MAISEGIVQENDQEIAKLLLLQDGLTKAALGKFFADAN